MSFISEISLTIIIAFLKLKLHITTFTMKYTAVHMQKWKTKMYRTIIIFRWLHVSRFLFYIPIGQNSSQTQGKIAKTCKIDTPHTGTHAHMYRRRTDHAMPIRKRYKRKNNDQQNTTQKTRSSNTWSELRSPEG